MPNHDPSALTGTAKSLDELLSLYDERFVRCAYLTLLGREADASGLSNYVRQLRRGAAKVQLIVELAESEEGRNAGPKLQGLAELVEANKLRPPSLLKRVAARISHVLLAPLAPQLRAMDNEIHAIGDRTEQRFNQLQASTGTSYRERLQTAGGDNTALQDAHQDLAADLIAAAGRSDLPANAAVLVSRLGVALSAYRGRA